MPDYIFALGSALLWAISAPVINHGLKNIPNENPRHWICAGMWCAMLTGILVLTPYVYTIDSSWTINLYLILSGIITFPLATGAYYLSSHAFSKRTEFASLFSKVKPLLSFLMAVFILKESVNPYTLLSASLVTIGIALLFIGVKYKAISASGVLLGLLTALLWSIGEVLMKLGIEDIHPVVATWIALICGLVVFTVVTLPIVPRVLLSVGSVKVLWPFFLHGGLSFGIAYSLFFYSIDLIGLGRSVLINAFWPILGILLTAGIRLYRNQKIEIPMLLIWAALFLLAGSLVQSIFEF